MIGTHRGSRRGSATAPGVTWWGWRVPSLVEVGIVLAGGVAMLAAQVEQAYTNVAVALEGVGAGFDDVARLTVYVVDWTPDKMAALVDGATRVAASKGIDLIRPITLIGVAALGEPDLLVEVEALAVLP